MDLIIEGTVKKVLPLQSGVSATGKEWKKQDFVITTLEQYAKDVCIQAFNKTTEYVDNLQEGDNVNVSFNLESKGYQGKYYTQVTAWKIEKTNIAQTPKRENAPIQRTENNFEKQPEITHNEVMKAMQLAGANVELEPSDDLPF